MSALGARRALSLFVLLAATSGFVGGAGWTAGNGDQAAVQDIATVEAHAGHAPHGATDTPAPAPAPAGTAVETHAGHHGHHAPQAAAPDSTSGRKHHDHDCEKGICRCDSRCPARRSGPCGGALRSCPGGSQEAGVSPGPLRPFVLPAAVLLRPVFDRLDRPDVAFVPVTRALEPASPPPRTSSV